MSSSNSENPQTATFFAFGGAAASIAFTAIGAAYGTAKSGNGISIVATRKPALIMKAIIPVVMAGVLAIYGLVVSVLIVGKVNTDITNYTGFKLMGAGLTNGFSGLAAGYCTGVIAESGLDGTSKQPKLFVGMVLMLAWCQALGLYGLLAALIMGAS